MKNMNKYKSFALTALLLVPLPLVHAELQLPAIIGDHMVLQQQLADPIWGWDTPGTKVTVTFAGQKHAAVAGSDGKWTVKLDPLPASAEPHKLVVQGTSTREINDVLVGEVWLCSGQSNMGFRLATARNGDLEMLTSHYPQLRLISVPNVGTQVLQTNFNGAWTNATPDTAGAFSAIGFMFGRYLHQSLQVPVGIINNAWGGSQIDAWLPRSALAGEPRFKARMDEVASKEAVLLPDNGDAECARIDAKWQADCEKAKAEKKPAPFKPIDRWLESAKRAGNIYGGVLHPTIGYGIKGVIWYQGESDYGRSWEYAGLFPFMIQQWRKEWNEGDFPFYWVQLPNFKTGQPADRESGWVQVREAQTQTLKLTNTAQVVTIDLGEENDIHPKRKHEVAARLARVALARDYGFTLRYRSPEFKTLTIHSNKATLTFDCFGSKLTMFNVNEILGFIICGADKKWHAAQGKIIGANVVELWSDKVQSPMAVRYAWSETPVCNLYSADGLPVTPFRTDDFELLTEVKASSPSPDKIAEGPFEPTPDSLQNYECPEWFCDAKFGIWSHWGPASVPKHNSNWYAREMYMEGSTSYKYHVAHYGHPSKFGYKDIIALWTCEKFDPDQLMALYKEAGAKYFVAQANHHDNFDLWNSKYHKWNSLNYGPHKDIVGLWRGAALKQGLRFGFTSHAERTWSWFQTNKGADKDGSYKGVPYDGNDPQYEDLYLKKDPAGDTGGDHATNPPLEFRQDWLTRINDVVNRYDPDLMYVDGPVPFFGDDKAQTGLKMIANLYNHNAQLHNGRNEAVMCVKKRSVNWFNGIATQDVERGHLGAINPSPWQTDTSTGPWFYDLDWKDGETGTMYASPRALITQLIDIVSKNGNLLLNVTQLPDGSLDSEAVKLLADIGSWMKVNGEGIYSTRPWRVFGEGPATHMKLDYFDERDIRFTQSKDKNTLYAFLMGWPKDGKCLVKSLANAAGQITDVAILGATNKPDWQQTGEGLVVTLPSRKPCDIAYALKITGHDLKPTPSKIEPIVYPDASGNVGLFVADLSEIHGNSIQHRIMAGKDQLCVWTNPKDFVSWNFKLDQPGDYEVEVTYASRPAAPIEFTIAVGNQNLNGKLTTTGATSSYGISKAGSLKFDKPGSYTLNFNPKAEFLWNTGFSSIMLKRVK